MIPAGKPGGHWPVVDSPSAFVGELEPGELEPDKPGTGLVISGVDGLIHFAAHAAGTAAAAAIADDGARSAI